MSYYIEDHLNIIWRKIDPFETEFLTKNHLYYRFYSKKILGSLQASRSWYLNDNPLLMCFEKKVIKAEKENISIGFEPLYKYKFSSQKRASISVLQKLNFDSSHHFYVHIYCCFAPFLSRQIEQITITANTMKTNPLSVLI